MPLQEASLRTRRRVLGDNHSDTLSSIGSMGELLARIGKYEEAERYFLEALECRRRVLGDEHPDTLLSISNMGTLLNKLSRHDEAAELLQAGEAAARQVWTGDNARRLGSYLGKLGKARAGQGEFPAAEKTLLEAHALLSAGFGADHSNTVKTIGRIVDLYDAWHAAEPEIDPLPRSEPSKARLGRGASATSGIVSTTPIGHECVPAGNPPRS